MKYALLLKAFSLVVALFLVIGMMRGLKPAHIARFFDAIGASDGPPSASGKQVSSGGVRTAKVETDSYWLCRTRIHALVWPDGRKIEEFKKGLEMRWMAYEPEPRELGYIDVEKWLGSYCRVSVEPISDEVAANLEFVPFLRVEFIDSETKTIARAGDHYKVSDGRVFRSEELSRAFVELQKLADFAEKPAASM